LHFFYEVEKEKHLLKKKIMKLKRKNARKQFSFPQRGVKILGCKVFQTCSCHVINLGSMVYLILT